MEFDCRGLHDFEPSRKHLAQAIVDGKGAAVLNDDTAKCGERLSFFWAIRVRRDNWASVRYAEGLNSSKSSVTLQSTDRHDILGQKSAGFQLSLGKRYAECAPHCPQDGLLQK